MRVPDGMNGAELEVEVWSRGSVPLACGDLVFERGPDIDIDAVIYSAVGRVSSKKSSNVLPEPGKNRTHPCAQCSAGSVRHSGRKQNRGGKQKSGAIWNLQTLLAFERAGRAEIVRPVFMCSLSRDIKLIRGTGQKDDG